MSLCATGTPWLAAPALDRGETQLLLLIPAWGGPAGRWLRLQELRGHPGDTQDGDLGSRLQPCARVSPWGGCGVAPGGCWERSAGVRGHALRHGVRAPGAEPLADGSGLGLRGAGVGFGRRPFERGRAVSCEPRRLSRARLGSRDLVAPSERSAFLYF